VWRAVEPHSASGVVSIDNMAILFHYENTARRGDDTSGARAGEGHQLVIWNIRLARAEDETRWRELYRGYRRFYDEPDDEERVTATWRLVLDPACDVLGFVAEDEAGRLAGLANARRFTRPLAASTGLYLDDLFTDPDTRGGGAGRALLDHLAALAHDEGMTVVRWITADSNTTARRLYDSVAKATPWVTYDMAPRPR
jgi:GNAT superfamily N-acetyltransferase